MRTDLNPTADVRIACRGHDVFAVYIDGGLAGLLSGSLPMVRAYETIARLVYEYGGDPMRMRLRFTMGEDNAA